MLDRRRRDELDGVLNLGRLADKMVFALGRALRSEELRPDDVLACERARQLFELMTREDVIVLDSTHDRMLNDESYLDALHVVELRAQGELEDVAQRYVELLDKLATVGVSDDERADLAAMRELFIELGEATISHANDLSRPRQEPSWPQTRHAISHF